MPDLLELSKSINNPHPISIPKPSISVVLQGYQRFFRKGVNNKFLIKIPVPDVDYQGFYVGIQWSTSDNQTLLFPDIKCNGKISCFFQMGLYGIYPPLLNNWFIYNRL